MINFFIDFNFRFNHKRHKRFKFNIENFEKLTKLKILDFQKLLWTLIWLDFSFENLNIKHL